jgi:uncharacterized membrane protein (UPF0127 family)
MISTFTRFIIIICFLAFVPITTVAHTAEIVSSMQQNQLKVVIITPSDPAAKRKTFQIVLLCDTPESRMKGLQDFRQLKRNEAALFVFDGLQIASFWMASVAHPIDIIFVGPDNKVIRVYRNCKPGSKDLYRSGKPAKWVIETAAGSGIKLGDRVEIK